MYGRWGLPGHEGVDVYAPHGTPIRSVADGIVYRTGDERERKDKGGHNYGVRVYIRHADGYRTTYAHLDRRSVSVGDRVKAGTVIGYADNTGNSSGSHLHLTLSKDGSSERGETPYPYDIVDPMPFLFKVKGEIEGVQYVDLLPIMRGVVGKVYMVEAVDNSGNRMGMERYQSQLVRSDKRGWTWRITKNGLYEQWGCSGRYIRLYHDTSPEPHSGIPAYYEVVDAHGDKGGRWCERFMIVGETFVESQVHSVTFRKKSDCSEYGDPRSGRNRNITKLFSFDGKVAKIGREGGEVHLFHVNYGRIGWESPWGKAFLSKDTTGGYDNEVSIIGCMK